MPRGPMAAGVRTMRSLGESWWPMYKNPTPLKVRFRGLLMSAPIALLAPAPLMADEASPALSEPVSFAIDRSLGEVDVVKLTPERLVQEVSRRNASAVYDQLQWEIAARQVDIEKAIFEPEFVASLMHQNIDVPNTVEEALARNFQTQYEEKANRYSLGLRGLVPTGGQWSLMYKGNESSTNIIERFKDYDTEYENNLELSFRQPLLKGRGADAVRAKTKVAELAQEIAYQSYRQRMMEVSGAAVQAYWNLYRAQRLLQSWHESVAVAERVLRDVKARAQGGKAAQTDVLEAETGLALRRARLMSAEADVVEARNRVLTLLNVTAEMDPNVRMEAAQAPEDQPISVPQFEQSLQRALANWPAYLIAQKKLESEKVQVKYARNQTLPQLDLTMGYEFVGLDDKRTEAIKDSYGSGGNSWYVGLELTMPLGNRAAKGQLSQAEIRAQQAVIEIESVRRSLSNSLHGKLERVRHAEEQLKLHRTDVELKRRLLEIELMRVEAGKSDVRELLRQEEDLIEYQRHYLNSVVELKLAEAAMDIAEGTLLEKYGIQVKRAEPDGWGEPDPSRNAAASGSAEPGLLARLVGRNSGE